MGNRPEGIIGKAEEEEEEEEEEGCPEIGLDYSFHTFLYRTPNGTR
jgi:hypothetical protein